MKSAVETLSPTRAKITVEVPFEELKPSLDAAYQNIAKQINIPGFRKGKVPPPVIDRQVGRGAVLDEAINDAPADDDEQPALFDEQRVRDYDTAMAGRRQTVYRVVAVHRESGAWDGLSMLCVDEFSPGLAFQEDTSVVRAHRGHRLGLALKCDMLLWLAEVEPQLTTIDTWNTESVLLRRIVPRAGVRAPGPDAVKVTAWSLGYAASRPPSTPAVRRTETRKVSPFAARTAGIASLGAPEIGPMTESGL